MLRLGTFLLTAALIAPLTAAAAPHRHHAARAARLALSPEESEETPPESTAPAETPPAPTEAPDTSTPKAPPQVKAAAAILVDAHTGQALFEKNAHQRRPMASTTKIMTATLILER